MLDSVNGNNGFHDHERWIQMCALLTANTLAPEELEQLNAHLEICAACRQAAAEFQEISRLSPSLLVGDNPPEVEDPVDWPQEQLKRRLFAAVDEQERTTLVNPLPGAIRRLDVLQYIALISLAAMIGIAGYFLGVRHPHSATTEAVHTETPVAKTWALQLADLTKERDHLLAKEAQETERIDHLSADLADQLKAVTRLEQELRKTRAITGEQETQLSSLQDENAALKSGREDDSHRLHDSQTSLAALRDELARVQQEHTTDLMQSAATQKMIDELSERLRASDAVLAEQKKFLDSDTDIRELMGARDLYVADVFDVAPDGSSRKPFGRVFYTKNKSLVFYAFDLDRQPNLRNASTFQAWGQNSLNKDRPVNMGVFYMDNEANRRWVLKFDNPKAMEQIDAVFVTAEPKGGSDRPSGKQLMYAYLRTLPNHP